MGDRDKLLELSTKDLTNSMVEFLVEDDGGDLDWVPERLRKKAEREKKARKHQLTLPSIELGLLTRLQHDQRSTRKVLMP